MTEVDNRIENILDEANEQLGGALSLIEAKDNVVGREADDSRKQPRGTFMFAGTTGTGKRNTDLTYLNNN